MLGMFCSSNCKTNEEYKRVIKGRILIFIGLIVLGGITLFVTLLGDRYLNLKIDESMISTYSGFGTGLTVVGVILLIKNISILNNEEKLRQVRISNTDERIKEISLKVSKVGLGFMLVTMYLVGLIGGLWYPVITQVLFFIICLFLVVYIIAYKVISKKI
ncbi:hypothetical protein R0131_05180 [Clostridium sp. AL.422]|uniref:hypothetical protein n=1 Tax=Clostridium TaxID=1485 RepID=UPI00293DBC8E|nr:MULTISPECIES: hypothetical protein [unclassified Clostridium]MDV4150226.1 hypothetical protein [Clostridium sp. AL.422]